MLFYLGILGAIGTLNILSRVQKRRIVFLKNSWKISGYWYGICFFLLIISCFRAESVGIDLVNYKDAFYRWGQLSFVELIHITNSDIGFVFYNWTLGNIWPDIRFFIICSSIITLIPIYATVKRHSRNCFMSLYLYVCMGCLGESFNIIRQAIALGIIFYCYRYVVEKKLFNFILGVFVAALFHQTALVAILICFLVNEKKTNRTIAKFLVLIIGVVLVTAVGIPVFVKIYKVNNYSDLIVSGEGVPLLIFYIMLGIIFYIILRCPQKDMKEERKREQKNLFVIYSLGVTVQILAIGFSILNRLTIYFMIFAILFIPGILDNMKDVRERTIAKTAIYGLYTLWFIYELYKDYSGVVPYTFMWT